MGSGQHWDRRGDTMKPDTNTQSQPVLASLRLSGPWCAQCGPDVRVDEDGCCASCGDDVTGEGADEAHRWRNEALKLRREKGAAMKPKTDAELRTELLVTLAQRLQGDPCRYHGGGRCHDNASTMCLPCHAREALAVWRRP